MLYCVKCKTKTPDAGKPHIVAGVGGRRRLICRCARCGTQKSQFIKSSGGGIRLPGRGSGIRLPGRNGAGFLDDVLGGINTVGQISQQFGLPQLMQQYVSRGRGIRRHRRGDGFKDDLLAFGRKGLEYGKEYGRKGLELAAREGLKYAPTALDYLTAQAKKRSQKGAPVFDFLNTLAKGGIQSIRDN
jgi:hypothetical protein